MAGSPAAASDHGSNRISPKISLSSFSAVGERNRRRLAREGLAAHGIVERVDRIAIAKDHDEILLARTRERLWDKRRAGATRSH
jgi:hypothetical protein